jgi:hypothetical protein
MIQIGWNKPDLGPERTGGMRSARPIFGAVVVALTLVPTLALAGPAPDDRPPAPANVRYHRQTAAPEARTEALDQRVKAAKAEQQADNEAVEAARAGDFHRRHQEAREMALIERQVSLLTKLLKVSDEDNLEKADLLFRLADLFLEQKAYHELQVGALYEPIHEAETAAGE